jgi:glycosyltransferase involved in cell wall biosynthesis
LVYQSHFVQAWWERAHGQIKVPAGVIYNGVDLSLYSPEGAADRPLDLYRILLVEGHFGGGNEMGLNNAVKLVRCLIDKYHLTVELWVAGDVPQSLRAIERDLPPGVLRWAGIIPRDAIPQFDRSAHLLFSADLQAACPNSVIEALACGLPVVAFATGALPELIQGGAGEVVPYGGDPWSLGEPDIPSLAQAAVKILGDLPAYRAAARNRAEQAFGLDRMVEQYLQVLL